MRNLFNKLKLIISDPKGRKQLDCMKSDFCDGTEDLSTLCLTCGDKKNISLYTCDECS